MKRLNDDSDRTKKRVLEEHKNISKLSDEVTKLQRDFDEIKARLESKKTTLKDSIDLAERLSTRIAENESAKDGLYLRYQYPDLWPVFFPTFTSFPFQIPLSAPARDRVRLFGTFIAWCDKPVFTRL